ncbi:hypothetical protein [Streptomyces sp. NPDC001194]|uniref:hypothetical protein n=1 Tax=Streptomyces sp. NPDC001194 TaxID=3364547 RepID=UPI00369B4415
MSRPRKWQAGPLVSRLTSAVEGHAGPEAQRSHFDGHVRLWWRAGTAKWVDVVSGFPASRHPRGSAERAEAEGGARAVREAVDAGDPYAASGDAATWLAIALRASTRGSARTSATSPPAV